MITNNALACPGASFLGALVPFTMRQLCFGIIVDFVAIVLAQSGGGVVARRGRFLENVRCYCWCGIGGVASQFARSLRFIIGVRDKQGGYLLSRHGIHQSRNQI
jgi:hypothetical protein